MHHMGEILIGTCGFSNYRPPDGGDPASGSKLAAYAADLDLVEVDRTFYSLPDDETSERWRREARGENPAFTFTVKAWQAVTHPISSPTWRGSDSDLTETEREQVGLLQPNRTVIDAWTETRAVADALDAPVVLLQTPPSFECSDEHERNLRRFLDSVDRDGIEIAWEPRGDWADEPERVRSICEDCDLVHVADPFRGEPLATTDVAYLRLHGRNEDVTDYDYSYDEDELREVATTLETLAADHERVFCLFDNYDMYEDARHLRTML